MKPEEIKPTTFDVIRAAIEQVEGSEYVPSTITYLDDVTGEVITINIDRN